MVGDTFGILCIDLHQSNPEAKPYFSSHIETFWESFFSIKISKIFKIIFIVSVSTIHTVVEA